MEGSVESIGLVNNSSLILIVLVEMCAQLCTSNINLFDGVKRYVQLKLIVPIRTKRYKT
jgi:hypothetical protein